MLHLAISCHEVVSQRGAGWGLGLDGVYGEAVRNELDEGCSVAGHQDLEGAHPQGQLCFLYTSILLQPLPLTSMQ